MDNKNFVIDVHKSLIEQFNTHIVEPGDGALMIGTYKSREPEEGEMLELNYKLTMQGEAPCIITCLINACIVSPEVKAVIMEVARCIGDADTEVKKIISQN